jgi:hypothetical protein
MWSAASISFRPGLIGASTKNREEYAEVLSGLAGKNWGESYLSTVQCFSTKRDPPHLGRAWLLAMGSVCSAIVCWARAS